MNREPSSARLVVVDLVLLAVAAGLALSPFADVYAGNRWTVAAAAGIALGVGATLLARLLRWGPVLTGLVVALGYLLVGPAAAVPDEAMAGVLPSLDADRALVTGIVESWRSMLTLPVPLSSDGDLIVPFVIALMGSVLASTLLWRTRWAGAAALVVGAMFVVAAAFGTRNADLPLARGILLVVLLLLWLRWRSLRHLRTSWVRRVSLGLSVIAVAAVAGWGLSSAMAGSGTREVLRDHIDPPLAELSFKSPLARYRDYYKNHKNDVLFTLTDLPAGEPLVRLATMDSLDGIVWNVSTKDLTTGSSPFRLAPGADGGSAVTVTVGDYTGPWVPSVGTAIGAELVTDASSGADRELLLNTATGAVAEYGNTRKGDVFRIAWSPRTERSKEVLTADVDRSVTVPPIPFAPIEKLSAMTQKWVAEAGATSAFEQAVALEQGFRENGYFNDGLDPQAFGYSPSGHGAKRLADLVQDPERMVGNDEQYASAMAYAAQQLGMPARVVLGFEKVRSDGTVVGDDIAAWVEIAFVDQGWITFDPTPAEDRIPPPLEQDPEPIPQPYVVQPPILPQEPADVQGVPPEGAGQDLADKIWDLVLRILGWIWTGLKVVLLLSPLWLILLAKRIRRRRRRRAADPVDRLSGGWREVTDRARDLGVRLPRGGTRYESGVALAQRFPEAESQLLAAVADRHVFGPGTPDEAEVSAYWDDVDTALARMRKSVPWWRRVLARLSPASIPWGEVRDSGRARLAGVAVRIGGSGAVRRIRTKVAALRTRPNSKRGVE